MQARSSRNPGGRGNIAKAAGTFAGLMPGEVKVFALDELQGAKAWVGEWLHTGDRLDLVAVPAAPEPRPVAS